MPRSVHDRLLQQELAMAFGVCHDCHGLGCYCPAPGGSSPTATPLPVWSPLPQPTRPGRPPQPQNIEGGVPLKCADASPIGFPHTQNFPRNLPWGCMR